MKNKFFSLVVACAALTMLVGCDPDDGSKPFTSNTLAGTWCLPLPDEDMKVRWYWELTKDGMLSYYEDYDKADLARFKDGYIINGATTDWQIYSFWGFKMQGKYEFDEATQTIYFLGYPVATLERISKDQAVLKSDYSQKALSIASKASNNPLKSSHTNPQNYIFLAYCLYNSKNNLNFALENGSNRFTALRITYLLTSQSM